MTFQELYEFWAKRGAHSICHALAVYVSNDREPHDYQDVITIKDYECIENIWNEG